MKNVQEILRVQREQAINNAVNRLNSLGNIGETTTNGWRGLGLRQMNLFGKQSLSGDSYTVGDFGSGTVSE